MQPGYLLRMMLRRILRMRDDLGIEMPLQALIELHLDHGFDLEGHTQTLAGVHEIVRLEEERYSELIRKGTRLVQSMIQDLDKKAKSIPDELLFVLNDSHGMGPEVATAIARDAGWPDLTVRPGFTAELAARHAERVRAGARAPAEESMPELDQHQETERLYVADVMAWEFDARFSLASNMGMVTWLSSTEPASTPKEVVRKPTMARSPRSMAPMRCTSMMSRPTVIMSCTTSMPHCLSAQCEGPSMGRVDTN